MKVKISIDNVGFRKKPSDKNDIVKAKYRTAKGWKEIELEELADLNGNKGYAIIPAHLVRGIKSENCTEMQICEEAAIRGNWQVQVRGLRVNQSCWDLELRILGFRILRKYISIV